MCLSLAKSRRWFVRLSVNVDTKRSPVICRTAPAVIQSGMFVAIASKFLRGGAFRTMTDKSYSIERWDLVIAHPPCTYLSNAGACRLYPKKGQLNKDRYIEGLKAKELFMALWYYGYYGAGKICIENPIPSTIYGLPSATQVIQPYEFGHPFTKKTYLWEFGIPPLLPTEIVVPVGPYVCGNSEIWKKQAAAGRVYGKEKSAKHRSKTFQGIAKAMAEQWG